MNGYRPEGALIITNENREYISCEAMLEKAMQCGRILESIATVCDENMNITVDLGRMKGVIPKSEIQYSTEEIKDIAVITRVGKSLCFKVTGFERNERGESVAMLSRREAQKECINNYILKLRVGDVIDAKITHLEPFGAFVDIGCGIVSLLSIDCISVSRISHPRERFNVGMQIKAVVKDIDYESGRVYVSHKELLGTWEENASGFVVGKTVAGIVRSIENYGVFIELTPNLAGLAEVREGIEVGQTAAVYIKNINPERMKIKLVIVDSGFTERKIKQPLYYHKDAKHIDVWRYSPAESQRIIETVF